MQVRNDFPNVDKVLRKLKEFVKDVEKKQIEAKQSNDESVLEDCERALEYVDDFIASIEKYLDSACNDSIRLKRYQEITDDRKSIQDYAQELEVWRTQNHSAVISSIRMVDKGAGYLGMDKIFAGLAEEFENIPVKLSVHNNEEKKYLTFEEAKQRRYLGNFGLYIAASLTLTPTIDDKTIEDFANNEGFVSQTVTAQEIAEIGKGANKVKKNANDILSL